MALNDFANLAKGIESILVSGAILVGGGWALLQFWTLRSVQKAKADLEKTRTDLLAAQRSLRERGTMNLSLAVSVLPGEGAISAEVSIQNCGNRSEVIDWERSFLEAIPTTAANSGFHFNRSAATRGAGLREAIGLATSEMAPGEVQRFPFIAPAIAPGVHLVVFHAACSALERQTMKEAIAAAGLTPGIASVWSAAAFVTVPDVARLGEHTDTRSRSSTPDEHGAS